MEINPSHPVTKALNDQWHKIVALILRKQGVREVVLTMEDIDALMKLSAMPTVLAHDKADGLHILFFDSEKQALAYAFENQKRG